MTDRLTTRLGARAFGGREFQGFHPQTGRATRVVFGDEGEARSLSVEGGAESKAVRVPR